MMRLLLAVLISLGLALAPITNAMPAAAMYVDHSVAAATASIGEECHCCGIIIQCSTATCATQCSQLGPAIDPAVRASWSGHTVLRSFEPAAYYGLAAEPPTPPPRT